MRCDLGGVADWVKRRRLWPVSEAAYQLGMHRVTLYRLMKAGEIRFVKVNNRTYVTNAELDRFGAVRHQRQPVR